MKSNAIQNSNNQFHDILAFKPCFSANNMADHTNISNECPYCGGVLPADRKVNFCPHCGQPPSGELKCPACGSEVDVGWGYCVSCGRATGFE